jgi:nicotinamidase-related amidase
MKTRNVRVPKQAAHQTRKKGKKHSMKSSMFTYRPSFLSQAKAGKWYKPELAVACREGIEYGLAHQLKPAAQLIREGVASAIMCTDLQEDFRPQGRLPVKGTDDVVWRVCQRIVQGVADGFYGGIIFSLDGHPPFHISYDYYWRDAKGQPLDLSKHGGAAILALEDEAKAVFKVTAFDAVGKPYEVGFYQARFDPKDSVAYWKHLQATNQGPIWVFVPHCMIGTDGFNLHPLLAETIAFACGARSMQPTVIHKGHISRTDWFGPLEPCRPDPNHPQGGFQKEVIDAMKGARVGSTLHEFRTVEFAGVAEDFCDYFMKLQVMDNLEGTSFMTKLRFISDGTAPIVPNAARVVQLNERARRAGIKFITHDTPFNESV